MARTANLFFRNLLRNKEARWWQHYTRRRGRSPLYSPRPGTAELPPLLVEREQRWAGSTPQSWTREFERLGQKMRGVGSLNWCYEVGGFDAEQAGPRAISDAGWDANVTVRRDGRRKRHSSSDGNLHQGAGKRRRKFRVYQLCSCTDHVCPQPYDF